MILRLIALPIVLAAATAVIQAKPAKNPHGLAAQLGLSANQKSEFKSIRQQARQDAQPVTDKMKENRKALDAAVKANDTAQIKALSKTQGELSAQRKTIRKEAKAKLYAELTPDQRTKMDQIHAQRPKHKAKKAA